MYVLCTVRDMFGRLYVGECSLLGRLVGWPDLIVC